MQYALGVAEVGPDKVFVDLNEFGFVVTEAVVDLGADLRSPPCRPGGIGFFGWLLSITQRNDRRRIAAAVRRPLTEEEAPGKTWAQEEDDAAAEVTDVI